MNAPQVKNSRDEIKVLVTVILVILALEATIRLFEDKLSGNINHIYSIPSIASKINQSKNEASILFLGNSLTNNAIDTAVVNSTINHNIDNNITSYKITPDGTALSDWYCIYKRHLHLLNNKPSYIIIGFAWDQLSDQYPVDPIRLGGFFCNNSDVNDLSDTGLTKHQQLLRFFAGSISHVYVNREAIRNKIQDMLIPHYKEIAQSINKPTNRTSLQDDKDQKSYHLLTRFINSIKSTGVNIAIIAMPVTNIYSLDNNLTETVKALNIPLLDMRNNIKSTMFKDSIHLNNIGKLEFSKNISNKLNLYIK